jgi:WD40 repeat protein
VWRPGRARAVAVFPGHPTSVAAIVFDPARGAFVSVDSAGNLRRWPSSYDEVPTLRGPAGLVTGIGFSSDGRRLASVSHDGTLRIWNVAGMREEARVDAPGQKFLSLAWLEGDATVVATATGGRVFLLHEGESTLGEGPPTAVSCLAVPLPGPDRFLVVDRGSVVRACAGTTVEAEWTAPGARMMSLASRADGLRAALGRDDGSISILDLRARRVLRSFAAHSAPVAAVAWSPDGTLLASGGHDGLARLWDPEDGMPRSEAREHASEVLVVGFTPDGTRWIAAGWDGQVRIRDTATGEDLLTLRGNGDPVWGLAVSRAGDRLAVAATPVGGAPTIRMWNAGAPDR